MTTVATNLREMAADQHVVYGDNPRFRTRKIFRIRDSIYGYCGEVEPALIFLEWRRHPRAQRPIFDLSTLEKDDFEVLELSSKGLFLWGKHLIPIEVRDNYYSIGTGAALAIWHMEQGIEPRRAVELALKIDRNSGGPVDSLRLGKSNGTKRSADSGGAIKKPVLQPVVLQSTGSSRARR